MRQLKLILIALIGTLGLSSACATIPPGKTLDVFLSAGDSWWFGTWLPVDSPGSIRDSVQMWSDVLKIKRIYWRGEQEEMMLDYGLIRKDNLEYHEFLDGWERYLMKKEHLNQALLTEAHRHNMEVLLWAPLFDYCGPADTGGCKEYPYYAQLNLTLQHPEWMPIDRYGVRRQNGPIELAYPEARKALIDMYLYYIDRDHLDGIAFFTYCESYGLRFEDEFGYNQPIVDQYKRRYGVDIRTQEFDKHLWHEIRGEYVTQFLRELKAALKERGKKLGVRLNPREPNMPDRWNVPDYFLTPGRIYMDWQRWVREGIVDELEVSGTVPRELQERTMENILQVTKGTAISVSIQAGNPSSARFKPYANRDIRYMLFRTDDASYVDLAYSAQPESALDGGDPYARIRFLSQVAEGTAKVDPERIVRWTHDPNILVRRQALRALGTLKDPRTLPVLEAALDDAERSVRSAGIFALAKIHRPESVARMIATVRKVREFQAFEAVSTVLVGVERRYLPEIESLAGDHDVLMRRMAYYVMGRRGDSHSLPLLIRGLKDSDEFARFRSATGLQLYFGNPAAADALIGALDDPSPAVDNRAAVSLAIASVKGCTKKPRMGLESSVGELETRMGPLPAIALDPQQMRVLDALTRNFHKFGDASTREDLDWGFRPLGNAMMAFGAKGGKRLQEMIDQKSDRRLATLAWQVLNIRQGIENFCRVPGEDAFNAAIYSTYPAEHLHTVQDPSPLKYDPTAKDE